MTSGDERGFNLLTARWLALGAAAGATLSLLAAQLGVQGPWQGTGLVLALLAGTVLKIKLFGGQP